MIVHAHGSVLETSKRPDLGVGPGGGARFDGNQRSDRIGDYALASMLAEEAVYANGTAIFDSQLLNRWGQPTQSTSVSTLNRQSIFLYLILPGESEQQGGQRKCQRRY